MTWRIIQLIGVTVGPALYVPPGRWWQSLGLFMILWTLIATIEIVGIELSKRLP